MAGMGNNYYAALGMEVARNDGSDYSRAASSSLDSASKTLGQIFDDTQNAFAQGKEDINAINDLLGSKGKINKDGSISGANGLYAIFDEVDRQNDLQARNLSEQIAKDNNQKIMEQERLDLAKNIKTDLMNTQYKDFTGLNKEEFNSVIDNAIMSELKNQQTQEDINQVLFLTPESIKIYLTNPLQYQLDVNSLTEGQKEIIQKIRNNNKLYNAIIKGKQIDERQNLIDNGIYTPEMIQDISSKVDDYYGTRDSRTQTEKDIYDSYLARNRAIGGIKEGESLDEFINRVATARNDKQLYDYLGRNPQTGRNGINNNNSIKPDNKPATNRQSNKKQQLTIDNKEQNIADMPSGIQDFIDDDDNNKNIKKEDNVNNVSDKELVTKNNDTLLINANDTLIPYEDIDFNNFANTVESNIQKIKPQYRDEYRRYIRYKANEEMDKKKVNDFLSRAKWGNTISALGSLVSLSGNSKESFKNAEEVIFNEEKFILNKAPKDVKDAYIRMKNASDLDNKFNNKYTTNLQFNNSQSEYDEINTSLNNKTQEDINKYNNIKKEMEDFIAKNGNDERAYSKEQTLEYNRIRLEMSKLSDKINNDINATKLKDIIEIDGKIGGIPKETSLSRIKDKTITELSQLQPMKFTAAIKENNTVQLSDGTNIEIKDNDIANRTTGILGSMLFHRIDTTNPEAEKAVLSVLKDESIQNKIKEVDMAFNETILPYLNNYKNGKISFVELKDNILKLSQSGKYFKKVNSLIEDLTEKLGKTNVVFKGYDKTVRIGNLNDKFLNQEYISKNNEILFLELEEQLTINNISNIMNKKYNQK